MTSSGKPDSRPAGDPHDLARHVRLRPERFREIMSTMSARDQVLAVLRMSPDDRVRALAASPRPMRLVRDLPAPELYLTVREVGPADALPVVGLASADQLHHVVDLESWRGDRFDGLRSGAWIALLAEAGESTLRRYVRSTDDAELALLFQAWARTEAIESDDQVPVHGHGSTEAGDERGTVSPDGNHRFRPEIPEHVPAVQRLARMLFHDDPPRYQRVLWAAISELPSQLEEDALRWRNSRLEEFGYPTWDEAMAVYAPPASDAPPAPPVVPVGPEDTTTPVARFALAAVADGSALDRALSGLDEAGLDATLRQMLALASRVVVADGLDTGDPATHVRAVRKAVGYVEIGLSAGGADPVEAVRGVALIEWFRRGHARIVELRTRARRLIERGWASAHPTALELLDPPIRPRLEGLLRARPLHHELEARGAEDRYREFEGPEDVEETRGAVELAETVGSIFVDRLGLDVGRVVAEAEARGRDTPRFSSLLLTLLAWSSTRGRLRLEPLPEPVVADFLRCVASRRTASPEAPAEALAVLIDRIRDRASLEPRESGLLTAFGKACLERLAEECSNLDPGAPVDDRHVSCLWLAVDAPKEGQA